MKIYFFNHRQIVYAFWGGALLILVWFLIYNYPMGQSVTSSSEFTPIYQGDADKKQISFAVNVDWGEEYIPKMLDLFKSEQIKCTFFLTGRWTEKFPRLAQNISLEGHEIGNHGYKHDLPNKMSPDEIKNDIRKTSEIINLHTGINPRLYAPPAGEKEQHVLKASYELGYQTILWSIDTIDWQRPAPEIIQDRVLKKIHSGAIILMHPTDPTVQALPKIINELKEKGYKLTTVTNNIKK